MVNYNIEIKKRNSANTGWDNLYPVTKASNVIAENGKSVEAHLAEYANHGNLKNKIINGNFDIWQRGSSFVTVATNTYHADRWRTSLASGNIGIYRNTNEGNLPFKSQYFLGVTRTAGALQQLSQFIENGGLLLSGKTVTLSYWARAITGSFVTRARIGTVETPEIILTPTWQRFTHTVVVTETSGHLPVYLLRDSTGEGAYIAQVQLEEGEYATPFEQRPIGLELVLCQRYTRKVSGAAFPKMLSSDKNNLTFDLSQISRGMRINPVFSNVSPHINATLFNRSGFNALSWGTSYNVSDASVSNVTFSYSEPLIENVEKVGLAYDLILDAEL